MATDKQHDKVREQRRIEVQQRQDIYQWGDDPDYEGLPGFIKSPSADALPEDVQFTHEDAGQLLDAKRKGICNTLHLKFRSLFQYWNEFEDFFKVGWIYDDDIYLWDNTNFFVSVRLIHLLSSLTHNAAIKDKKE